MVACSRGSWTARSPWSRLGAALPLQAAGLCRPVRRRVERPHLRRNAGPVQAKRSRRQLSPCAGRAAAPPQPGRRRCFSRAGGRGGSPRSRSLTGAGAEQRHAGQHGRHSAQEAETQACSTRRRRHGPARQAGISATLAYHTGGAKQQGTADVRAAGPQGRHARARVMATGSSEG